MSHHFISPTKYVQGPDVLADSSGTIDSLRGETAYLLGGETALDAVEADLWQGFDASTVDVAAVDHCMRGIIQEHAARDCGADVIVGVGGGVALDAAKAVAIETDAEMVSVPTVTSTDAPCSSVAVVYVESGAVSETLYRNRNPEVVLVDTRVIVEAPTRFLRHGMGDAFATRFQAESVARSNATTAAGGRSAHAALALVRETYQVLGEHSTAALAAAEWDAVTRPSRRSSRRTSSYPGSGSKAATRRAPMGSRRASRRPASRRPTGSSSGSGRSRCSCSGENPATLEDALSFYCELDLAVTLSNLGVDESRIDEIAAAASDAFLMQREPVPVTPASAADTLRAADQLIDGSAD